jgi:hypothetical protein
MEWSGRAPALPAMNAGGGHRRQGARHVTETRHFARRNRHRYRQELVPHASDTSVKRLARPLTILRYAAPIRPTALFDRNCKDIANAAFGPDDTWCLRVYLQLAPQPKHPNIDAAIEDVFVEPGRLQQILELCEA